MRISLIHGEDFAKAYEKYIALVDGAKKKNFDIIAIDDIHKIVSQSLFEDKIVFTLEKPKKVKPTDWKWFKDNASKYNSNLLIYWEGVSPVGVLRTFTKDAKIVRFDLPKIIFKFLDSVYPKNSKNCLTLLNQVCQTEPIELVVHLLSRQLRDLYWILVSKQTFEAPIWKIKNLAQQAGKFEVDDLHRLITDLADIDVKSKTGETRLRESLDILIVKHLQ